MIVHLKRFGSYLRFPISYKPTKAKQLPGFIPTDRFNKIPIFLDEKYFQYPLDDDEDGDDDIEKVNHDDRDVVNNIIGNRNENPGHTSRSHGAAHGCGNASVSKTKSNSSEALEKQFSTLFFSDEDNCNVQSSPESSFHHNQMPQETPKPAPIQYCNARELHAMKRSNKK